jgi:hypothetical protein
MQQLIFGGQLSSNPQSVEEDFNQLDEKREVGRESAYVTVFEGGLQNPSASRYSVDMTGCVKRDR